MKAITILPICLLLASCGGDSSPEKWERETFRELPALTQVAVILEAPIWIFALAAAIAAGRSE